jgi:hypothetical protein
VIWELVSGFWEHRPRCPACQTGPSCPFVRLAVGIVLDWHRRRDLLSRAEWLREKQADLEVELRLLRRSAGEGAA